VAAGFAAAATAGASRTTSPSGTIVFQRVWLSPIAYQIFSVRADGTALRQLTRGPARVDSTEPDRSPDGRWIVFQRGPHMGTSEVYKMRTDGTWLRRLTNCVTCHWTGDPSFSPDGASIVFVRENGEGRVAIWRMRADGTRQRLVLRPPKGSFADQPVVSPDGRRIAYRGKTAAGQTSIFVASADGRGARPITPRRIYASRPRWSPDGKLILFYTTNKDDLKLGVSANLDVIRPDGSGLSALTHDRGGSIQNYEASWSPDGSWIAFARETAANKPPGQHSSADIYVMRSDGTDIRRIVGVGYFDHWPTWGS
jgi:Tol biopolymer transport system component